MQLEIFKIDAFCRDVFTGNPAAVCPLEHWLDETLMQNIAAENNLAETAFYVPKADQYEIRWFTPTVEVDLCGHATLAAAHVLFNHKNIAMQTITFFSHRSGALMVSREGSGLTLNFPADELNAIPVTEQMYSWFSLQPVEAYKGKTDYMLVFESEDDILALNPNLSVIGNLKEARGVIATAKGNKVDFVSRFFAPQSGIVEDPVTGSAHTSLTPYWSKKLNKTELSAIQLSARRGYLKCKNLGERIAIGGNSKTFLQGQIFL